MKTVEGKGGRVRRQDPSPSLNAVSREVIGAAIEVHTALGPGLGESAYVIRLEEVREDEGLRVAREVTIPARFRGRELDAYYGSISWSKKRSS